eukprot:scaffold123637_cov64-Phaeocystis_antarctica.AAC.2
MPRQRSDPASIVGVASHGLHMDWACAHQPPLAVGSGSPLGVDGRCSTRAARGLGAPYVPVRPVGPVRLERLKSHHSMPLSAEAET